MQRNVLLVCVFCVSMLSLCGCLTPKMGIQQITNPHNIPTVSMVQIYNVIKHEFPDYRVELLPRPEISRFVLGPSAWGWVYIEPHHDIVMRSKENNILIQYQLRYSKKESPFIGIDIWYFLKGENCHDRSRELNEPMAKVKQCLIDNFPERITEDDFTETVRHMPHQLRRWQTDD